MSASAADDDDDSIAKCKKAAAFGASGAADDGFDDQDDLSLSSSDDYILGTLVVRVVAARDLELAPSRRSSGLRLFSAATAAATNPYASLEFRGARQRTSIVYDATNPIWPRSEILYIDVSLPKSQLTHGGPGGAASRRISTAASGETSKAGLKATGQDDAAPRKLQSHLSTLSFDEEEPFAPPEPPSTTLTVALFHVAESDVDTNKNNAIYPDKKAKTTGDSDDYFLGMATIDLVSLLTGRSDSVDEWLPVEGGQQERGATVRVVCEYEPTDGPLRPGDSCRLTSFCRPADTFPVPSSQLFTVVSVDRHANTATLSYRTLAEGWECTFIVHRHMVVCDERYQDTMATYQEEIRSITDRLSGSLVAKELVETAERVAVDGILTIGQDVVQGSVALFSRWMSGGLDTAIADVTHATNWNGQNYYGRLNLDEDDEELEEPQQEQIEDAKESAVYEVKSAPLESLDTSKALPGMPSCPITGEPMVNPVVAADGHTYEREAIARWLSTSDKSPMTGGVLAHKDLVPNYMLLSSLQEAANLREAKEPPKEE